MLAESLIAEIEREGKATQRVLERVPADKSDWRPHAKSRSLGELAWHVARIPAMVNVILREGKIDVDQARPPQQAGTDFAGEFRKSLAVCKEVLAATSDKVLLEERFAFVKGGQEVIGFPKLAAIRNVMMNHSIHHRGQLTVYLRLLDIPVPAVYGRSADDNPFERR